MSLRAGREYASTQCRPACPRPAPRGLTALRVAQGVAEDTHHGRIVDEVHTRVLQRSDTPQRHAWRVLVEPLPPAARVAHGLPHRSPRPRMGAKWERPRWVSTTLASIIILAVRVQDTA